MNAQDLAAIGYGRAAQPFRTPRAIEYDAFAAITREIKAALPAEPATFPKLVSALHKNRLLWSTLAADLVGQGNQLPTALKAQLLSLSEFVRLHSSKVLSNEADATVLVEINTVIMKGLQSEVSA